MKSLLAHHVNDHPYAWLTALPHIRMAYMHRVHKAIGATPFEMVQGLSAKTRSANVFLCPLCALRACASGAGQPRNFEQASNGGYRPPVRQPLALRLTPPSGYRQPVGGGPVLGDYVPELNDSTLPLCVEDRVLILLLHLKITEPLLF